MSADVSVVVGLAFISALFAYYAFELRESTEMINQRIAVFLFFMSVVFLNLVMYTIYQISQADTSLSFLTSGIMHTGLLIVVWTTAGLAFILLGSLLWMLVTFLWQYTKKIAGKYRNEEE